MAGVIQLLHSVHDRRGGVVMDNRIIFESGPYRIVEIPDHNVDFDNLCGDSFNPKVNPYTDPAELKRQLAEFTDLVNREGVYGYVLEKWNPEIGKGYEHIDSSWGFVGQYSERYIVEELKTQIGGES
jgi:hypothetical protein